MRPIGNLLRGFGPTSGGPGVGPTTPTLSVADNGNGTATATISTSSTGSSNSVYLANDVGDAWSLEGSRTGNGTVTLTLPPGRYFAYVQSILNDQSANSVVVLFRIGVVSGASLTHSPADVLRYLLVSLGGGTLPAASGSWPIHVSNEPTSPDSVITCYDTSGILNGRIQVTGEMVEHHGIQIRIRSATPAAGYTKANAIKILLDSSINRDSVNIDGSEYLVHAVTRQGGIANIGRNVPTSKLNIFTLNAIIALRQTI